MFLSITVINFNKIYKLIHALLNMGLTGIKYKILPESLEVNLKELEEKIKKVIEKNNGENREYSIEPIAFGLKAIIAFFFCEEDNDLENIEKQIELIKGVSSIQLIDMRKVA
jgi:translation elongation factor aEF-1 beta